MTQRIAASEYRRQLVRAMTPLGAFPVQFVADVTDSSQVVVNVSSILGLSVGMLVTGPGFPTGTQLIAVQNTPGPPSPVNLVETLDNAIGTFTSAIYTARQPIVLSVHLFKSPPSPGPEPVVTDFDEANFDGYSPIDLLTFVGPYTDQQNEAELDAEQVSWVLTLNPAIPNNVYGYWIQYEALGSSGPATVMLFEPFVNPLPMTAAGNAIVLVVPFTMPDPATIDVIP